MCGSSENANGPAIQFHNSGTLPSTGRVHVVGAGPVGLLLTALLQSVAGMPAPEIQFFDIHNYLVAG